MEKKNYIVGVDIGSSNVVMIVGSRNADGILSIDGISSQRVAGGVKAGRIDNVQSVGKAIRAAKDELEKDLGIRINGAYAGISGNLIRCASYTDHVFIQDSSRCITKDDVAALHQRMQNVLADENEQIIGRIPQNYIVDDRNQTDNPVGAFGRKLSSTFLFILCDKKQIDRVNMSFYNAGLQPPLDICANPAVLPNVLLSEVERDEGTAVIDIGGGATDVSIVRGGKLRYVASIPIGASSIDADLHAFGIAKIHAETMKKKFGSAIADMVSPDATVSVPTMPGLMKKNFLQYNLVAVIEARLKDIIEFAWDEIRSAKFSTKIPCGIVLTGGSALLENIDELFRRETGVNVRIVAARYGIDEESQQKIGTCAHSTAVAILQFGSERGFCDVTERVKPAEPAKKPITAVPPVQKEPEIAAAPKPDDRPQEPERPTPTPAPAPAPEQPIAPEPEEQKEPERYSPPSNPYEDEDDYEDDKPGIVGRAARWFNNLIGDKDNEYL